MLIFIKILKTYVDFIYYTIICSQLLVEFINLN